jgi:hypothetical protein
MYLYFNKFITILAFISSTCFLSSCGESTADDLGSSIVKFSIDGSEPTLRVVGAVYPEDIGFLFNFFTPLSAEQNHYLDIEFKFTNFSSLTGTYTSADDELSVYVKKRKNKDSPYVEFDSENCAVLSMQLVITAHDTEQRTISGTFSGTVCGSGGNNQPISGQFNTMRYALR